MPHLAPPVAETARQAGRADIIRTSLDGRTAGEPLPAREAASAGEAAPVAGRTTRTS